MVFVHNNLLHLSKQHVNCHWSNRRSRSKMRWHRKSNFFENFIFNHIQDTSQMHLFDFFRIFKKIKNWWLFTTWNINSILDFFSKGIYFRSFGCFCKVNQSIYWTKVETLIFFWRMLRNFWRNLYMICRWNFRVLIKWWSSYKNFQKLFLWKFLR